MQMSSANQNNRDFSGMTSWKNHSDKYLCRENNCSLSLSLSLSLSYFKHNGETKIVSERIGPTCKCLTSEGLKGKCLTSEGNPTTLYNAVQRSTIHALFVTERAVNTSVYLLYNIHTWSPLVAYRSTGMRKFPVSFFLKPCDFVYKYLKSLL